ncbi:MAG: hypothetical protein R3B70_33945 [Polyangiaceae bacterium]
MAVPGHDERDFEFAKAFDVPIIEVVSPDGKLHAPASRLCGRRRRHGTRRQIRRPRHPGLQEGHDRQARLSPEKGGIRHLQAPRLGLLPPALLGEPIPSTSLSR